MEVHLTPSVEGLQTKTEALGGFGPLAVVWKPLSEGSRQGIEGMGAGGGSRRGEETGMRAE